MSERDALHAALGRVARIVERRSTIPVLSNVLLEARDGGLMIKATDLDIEASTRAVAEVSAAGRTTVAAHLLAEIVGKLPSGAQVRLEVDGEGGRNLVVKSGRARMTLHTLPAGDFPDIAPEDPTHRFALPAATLAAMIAKTEFAISSEETRYYLNGIYLHALAIDGATVLRAVATDGHRLARWQVPAPEGATDAMPGVIVPRKAIAEMKRLAKDAAGPIEIALDARCIVVDIPGKTATTTLRAKLIDGTFPDYQRVIPASNGKRATLPRDAAIAAAARVACISSERGRAVKLTFADDRLVLACTHPDAGQAADEIDIGYAHAPIDVGFNVAYLGEILGTMDGDEVHLNLADPGSPALFQETTDSDALLLVLMPMRV